MKLDKRARSLRSGDKSPITAVLKYLMYISMIPFCHLTYNEDK